MTRTLEELREYLVGEWLFDNDFLDTSGNGNHGTPTDIEWKPTARGLKPYFNGSSSYIYGDALFSEKLNEFTLSCMVYLQTYELPENPNIFSQLSSGTDSIRLELTSTGTYLWVANESEVRNAASTNIVVETGKYSHLITVFDNGNVKFFINGELIGVDTVDVTTIKVPDQNFYIGSRDAGDNFHKGYINSNLFYSTALTDDEVLALYNSTKNAVGVRPAERSFTHRLQPDVDANTVFATDMSTKNADGTLMDLSGNSNHGDIQGAVRAGGYFTDGMRFDGDNDRINFGTTDNEILENNHSIEFLASWTDDNTSGIVSIGNGGYGTNIRSYNQKILIKYKTTIYEYTHFNIGKITNDGIYHHVIVNFFTDGTHDIYIDGIKYSSYLNGRTSIDGRNEISHSLYAYNDMQCVFVNVKSYEMTNPQSRFNSLATLPLYTFDASKYPTSSGWTANVPYSSMSITSGEFSFTDNGQLQCDSVGSFSLRNAHSFDGSEYIKVTIDGVEYAGTGTVTEGNVTVAITQGSTMIDVDMGTDDVIDSIDIQFREPVE
jgi:hypothetical protein